MQQGETVFIVDDDTSIGIVRGQVVFCWTRVYPV
jgi:hypothetical protein